ncbi:MAG: ABC transporter substrate-binding protein [Oscillospiraceae bacterium]|jgi:iron complex transport system substrate-binding protein|nr:ABC transporter substrate-binding protein [Oscillospiraceae bacterium]
MKKTLALLLVLAMIFTLFAACNSSTATPTDSPTQTAAPTATAAAVPTNTPDAATPEPQATTQSFTDSVGRTVELPASITKISPSGALAQMFLLAIAPDLLCTVASKYSDNNLKYVPSYLNDLPEVGQFYGSDDLNFESIAAINPEVVIDLGEPKKTIVEDMDSITEKLAIPAVHITADLRGTADAFRTLGKLLGREAKGEELAAFCEKALASSDDYITRAGDGKPTILYLLGDAGLNVLAKTSFHAEILDFVADNIAVVDEPSSRGSGNETDLEQISIWNPEVILFGPGSVYSTVAADPTWSQLDAIKNGRYYEVPEGPYNWMGSPPSINRYLGMIWLTQILYGDSASVALLKSEVVEYYNLFYGHTLTDAEYSALTANALPK